eukprot:scaffold242_cov267-Pinguiococcus_pyrenoidosus.AAC.1
MVVRLLAKASSLQVSSQVKSAPLEEHAPTWILYPDPHSQYPDAELANKDANIVAIRRGGAVQGVVTVARVDELVAVLDGEWVALNLEAALHDAAEFVVFDGLLICGVVVNHGSDYVALSLVGPSDEARVAAGAPRIRCHFGICVSICIAGHSLEAAAISSSGKVEDAVQVQNLKAGVKALPCGRVAAQIKRPLPGGFPKGAAPLVGRFGRREENRHVPIAHAAEGRGTIPTDGDGEVVDRCEDGEPAFLGRGPSLHEDPTVGQRMNSAVHGDER